MNRSKVQGAGLDLQRPRKQLVAVVPLALGWHAWGLAGSTAPSKDDSPRTAAATAAVTAAVVVPRSGWRTVR